MISAASRVSSRGARPALLVGALLVGAGAAFVAAVLLARTIGPTLLADPEASWALPRLLLGLALAGGAAAAGVAAASGFLAWSRSRVSDVPLEGLALGRTTLVAIAAAGFLAGCAVRFYALDRIPVPLWVDDISLVEPTVDLAGTWSDFADSIRPAPYGVSKPFGTVGVLYLELRRLAFELVGVNVFGVRLPAAVAGCFSLLTAAWLGRALLPTGGGTLALLALAGMRWHLILCRWGWQAVVVTPLADLAALFLLRARRSGRAPAAILAGVMAGLGAHVYLVAWVVAVALVLFALWPGATEPPRRRVVVAAGFATGFLVAVAPLFLFRENRAAPYFVRVQDHSLLLEMQRARSPMPFFSAAAEAPLSPWFIPDPVPINDLPGRSRLGWILGVPVAVALARALRRPNAEISAFLLCQAAAAFAASVASGLGHAPNGYRFGCLTTVAAVAAAAGGLWLVGLAPAAHRRAASLAFVGLLAVNGAFSARDALVVWGESRVTFDYFHGPDTLLARALVRWEGCGPVQENLALVHSPITFGAVRRYRLDPWAREETAVRLPADRRKTFRIHPPGTEGGPGNRVVERVRDVWGREWGVVLVETQR